MFTFFFVVVQMNHTKTVQHSRTLTRSVCEIQLRSVIDFFASAIAEWQSESEFVIIAYLSFYVCGNTWFDDYQKQNKFTPCSVELIPVSSSALTLLYSRNPVVRHSRYINNRDSAFRHYQTSGRNPIDLSNHNRQITTR